MATEALAAAPASTSRSVTSVRGRKVVLVGALLAVAIAGLIGTARSDVKDLEGTAYVGEHVATIESGGWSYGFSDSVAWIDRSGTYNEEGWPECLGKAGNTANVRFGAVPVPQLGIQAIVYIDCRTG